MSDHPLVHGVVPIRKPKGCSSFSLVRQLRRITKEKKIGHAGTLDPFATGVMVMLIGREFTKLSDKFLNCDKEYVGTIRLGVTTDTYDSEGVVVQESSVIPTFDEIQEVVARFQGNIEQTPPMYSAKKVDGKKLYELARQGKEIERKAVTVNVNMDLLDYSYPFLKVRASCSKGTYIRSLAYDMGLALGCGAHLSELTRTRSGDFTLEQCLDADSLTLQEITKYFMGDIEK